MRQVVHNVDDMWQQSKQDHQFHKITALLFIIALLFAVLILNLQLPAKIRAEQEKLPAQLLNIIKHKKIDKPAIIEERLTEEEKLDKLELTEKEKETDKVIEVQPQSSASRDEKIVQAKKTAKKSGLLALADQLSDMHQSADLTAFTSAEQQNSSSEEGQIVPKETALLSQIALNNSTQTATEKNSQDRAREIGGKLGVISAQSNLTSVQKKTSYHTSVQGNEGYFSAAADATQQQASVDESTTVIESLDRQTRSTESIRQVFDKNKGALFAIYRRALRQDPSLEGKVMIEIVIEPDGTVSMVKLLLSELDFVELENKLLARIKLINFGLGGNDKTKLNYTFNFLPF